MVRIDSRSRMNAGSHYWFRDKGYGRGWGLPVVMVTMSGAACSTLEVEEGYVTSNKASTVEISNTSANITVGFIPESTFNSFGVLGVPAVPVRATSGHSSELHLRVTFGFTEHQVFSLANSPCLIFSSGEQVCSQKVTLGASAMRRDPAGPAGWQPITGMSLKNRGLEIAPSALTWYP